jgi:hypothetical protein
VLAGQLYRIKWCGETDANADQVFADANKKPQRQTDTETTAAWPAERLAGGPIESTLCVQEGNKAAGAGQSRILRLVRLLRDTANADN